MTTIGPAVPRDSAEYGWVSSVVRAVEKLSGRPSRWNGQLFEETRPNACGRALDDGGLALSVPNTLKPVANAYTAGRPLTDVELLQARDAVLTVVHEAKHLMHELGDESAPGAVPVYSADALALEEGLVETWAHHNVDAVIQEIRMDQAVPGLLETEYFDTYPAYTAATDELVRGSAEVAGVKPDQVRARLEQADRTQRWSALADLVIDQRMADVMPPEHRDVIRTQMAQAMRPHLADVMAIQPDENQSDLGKSIAGHQSAQRAVTALSTMTADAENHYRDWYRQQGIAPARPQQQPAQAEDVEHLRKFLGDQRPGLTGGGRPPEASSAPATVRQLGSRVDHGPGLG